MGVPGQNSPPDLSAAVPICIPGVAFHACPLVLGRRAAMHAMPPSALMPRATGLPAVSVSPLSVLSTPPCTLCGMAETTNTTAQVQKTRASGTAITSAVIGIVALTVGLVVSTALGVILGVIGLIFGGVAVYRSREGRSVWVPALVVNGLTVLVGLLSLA